jgi:hypothetical protein
VTTHMWACTNKHLTIKTKSIYIFDKHFFKESWNRNF